MADKKPILKIKSDVRSQLSKINSNGVDSTGQNGTTSVNNNGPKRKLVYNTDGSLKGVEEVNQSGQTFPAFRPPPAPLLSKEGEVTSTDAPKLGMGDVLQTDANTENANSYGNQMKPMTTKDFEVNTTPADETKRDMFNYEKLNDYPVTKKYFKDRKIIPLPHVLNADGNIKLDDPTPYYQQMENSIKTETLDKLNSMDIPIIKSLSDEAKLQYAGAQYMNNPFVAGLSGIITPIIAGDNLVRGALNKFFGGKYDMIPYPEYKGDSKSDELMNFGASMISNLIPLGVATKGAGYVFRGIQNPYLKEILSTAVGFTGAQQPQLLDQLQQGQITKEDYARETAKSIGMGATFGVSGPLFKGNFTYSLPYNAIVPSLVPVIVDFATGKDINYEELGQNIALNPLLDIGLNWRKLMNSPLSSKLKSSKNPYADTKVDLIFNPKTGKYEQVISVEKEMFDVNGEPYTGVEKQVLQEIAGLLPNTKKGTDFVAGEKGDVRKVNQTGEPMLMKEYKDLSPEEVKSSQRNIDTPFKMKDDRVVREGQVFEAPQIQETPIEKNVNSNIASADPKGVMEFKTEQQRVNSEFETKLNKEPIQEITNPALVNSQSKLLKNKVEYLNEAIREHNKQFEVSAPEKVIENDLLTEQNRYLDGKISETKAALEKADNNAEVNRLNNMLEMYEIKKNDLKNIAGQETNNGGKITENGKETVINEPGKKGTGNNEQKNTADNTRESSMLSDEQKGSAKTRTEEVKKTWEYQRDEYINDNPEGVDNKNSGAPIENLLMDKHERAVRDAYAQGLDVPSEVLKDYPQVVLKTKRELRDFIDSWDKVVNDAKKNIKARGNNLNMGVDVTALKDYAIVGADYLKKGIVKIGEFGKKMVAEYGPGVARFVRKIFDASQILWQRVTADRTGLKNVKTQGIGGKNKNIYDVSNGETFGAYAKRIINSTGEKNMDLGALRKKYSIGVERNKIDTAPLPPPSKGGGERTTITKNEQSRFSKSAEEYNKETDDNINKWQKNEADRKAARKIVKEAIRELPAIEEKLMTEGMNKYDVAEKLSAEITKKIFATPEYKQMDNQGRQRVRTAIKNYFEANVKEPSQIEKVLFKGPKHTVWGMTKEFTNRALKQSSNVVKRYGAPGREFVRRLKKMADDERVYLGKAGEVLFDINKNLSKDEYRNLKDIRRAKRMVHTNVPEKQKEQTSVRGYDKTQEAMREKRGLEIPQAMNEKVAYYDKMLDEFYDNIAKEFKAKDFMTKNPYTGEVYFFSPRHEYEPRILKDDVDLLAIEYKMTETGDFMEDANGVRIPMPNKSREKVLEYLVETGQAKNKGEASFLLNNVVETQYKFRDGNVEYARSIDLPPEYYKDDVSEVLLEYTSNAGKRLAYAENFGKDGDIGETLFNEMRDMGHDDEFARRLLRYDTQSLNAKEQTAYRVVNSIKNYQTITKFTPFTTLRNSFQGILGTSTRGNLKAGLTGLIKSFTAEAKRNAYKSGALAENLDRLVVSELSDNKSWTGKYLKIIGFTSTDRWNKIISAAGGEVFYKDMLSRIQNDSILKRRAYREFEKLGLNPDEVVKRGKFTEDELNLIRRTFAGDAQLTTRPQDLPLWWSSPTGKLVTQWKSFSFRMTKLITDSVIKEAKAGNLFPIFSMLVTYGVAGESVNMIIDYLRNILDFDPKAEGKDYESPREKMLITKAKEGDWSGFGKRLVEDLAGLGALSFFADSIRSFGYGKSGTTGMLFGPLVAEAVQIGADLFEKPTKYATNFGTNDDAKSMLASGYDALMRQFPGAGIPRTFGVQKLLKEKIFGKEDMPKNDFYRTLNDTERADMKKIETAMKERREIKNKKGAEYQAADKKVYYLQKNSGVWKKYDKFMSERKKDAEEE